MPSVTEVLEYLTEPELLNWLLHTSKAKREAVQDAALTVGIEVDLLVQQDVTEGGYLLEQEEGPIFQCMQGWETFKKDHPDFVLSIKKVQEEIEHNGVVGHPDFIIELEDKWGVVDLKCSSSIRPRYWTQTAAYVNLHMLKESIRKVGFIGILRLDKTLGTHEYKEIKDEVYINYEIRVFNAYLTAYHHNMRNREQIRQQLEEELLCSTA